MSVYLAGMSFTTERIIVSFFYLFLISDKSSLRDSLPICLIKHALAVFISFCRSLKSYVKLTKNGCDFNKNLNWLHS